MARELCQRCEYPIQTCLCDSITQVSHKTKVIILQHPSEVKNAKNTVRLLKLMSNNTSILIGESEQNFDEIKQQVLAYKQDYALLFPGDDAVVLSEQVQASSFRCLIIIDGTWKKAKKLLLLNPWLNDITKVSFNQSVVSEYQIRSTSVQGGLSTIEAVAYSLNEIENCSTAPFIRALNGLKHSFTKRMPNQVKARYQPREE